MSSPTQAANDASEASPADTAVSEPDEATREELTVQLELLREQNQRLRDEYRRAQQQTYRRSALGLLGVGLVAILGGIVLPTSQQVLFALGGTGVFAGVLTYYLTPERFITATVSEGVYDATTADREAVLDELGLTGTPVYMPAAEPRVYLSEAETQATSDESLPEPDALSEFFVTTGSGAPGVAMTPTGKPLFEEFNQSVSGSLGSTPQALVAQLTDGLVEDFELADGVDASVNGKEGRVTLEFTEVTYGDPERFDHPVNSFVATGLAVGLEKPVRIEITQADPPVVTYRWEATAAD
jgi:hypothetical protein